MSDTAGGGAPEQGEQGQPARSPFSLTDLRVPLANLMHTLATTGRSLLQQTGGDADVPAVHDYDANDEVLQDILAQFAANAEEEGEDDE
jgi:hypothetical protein